MDICRETVCKVLETLFPEPKYILHEYIDDSGSSYYMYRDYHEVFSFHFYRGPEIFFRSPTGYPDVFNTLNEVFELDKISLYSYEIKGFKDDSK